MHLIVGLGNPGKKYARNRHNVGFMALERLAEAHGMSDFKEKWSGLFAKGEIAAGGKRHPVTLLMPQTFMNLSGDSVQPAAAFLKVAPANVIVLHDEIDLPWSDVRLKIGGGHAGNNGIRSTIQRLGAEFVRVRIGVGRPPAGFKGEVADWVLGDFDAMERAELPDVLGRACVAVERVVADGLQTAMNAVNTKPAAPKPAKPKPAPPTPVLPKGDTAGKPAKA